MALISLHLLQSFFEIEFEGTILAYAHFYKSVLFHPLFNIPEIHLVNIGAILAAMNRRTVLFSFWLINLLFCSPSAADLPLLVSRQIDNSILFIEFAIVFFGEFLPIFLINIFVFFAAAAVLFFAALRLILWLPQKPVMPPQYFFIG